MFNIKEDWSLDNAKCVVTYVAFDMVVFEDKKTGLHYHYSIQDAQKLYLEHRLIPEMQSSELSESEISTLFTFLTEYQKKELHIKLTLVNSFYGQGISKGTDAQNLIAGVCKTLGLHHLYGESTVRNWVTRYKNSGLNPLSLLDLRRKTPFYADNV